MSITKPLTLLIIFSLFYASISCATPYISMNASIDLTKNLDTSHTYDFAAGQYDLSIIFHAEGLLSESDNEYSSYYRFNRDFVDIKINDILIAPLYPYYNAVRVSYYKAGNNWELTAITTDDENYREGTISLDYFQLSTWENELAFQDITQLIPVNGAGIEVTSTRYDYVGDLNNFDYQLFELTTNPSPVPVPEPATFILLGSGLVGLAFYRRKHK